MALVKESIALAVLIFAFIGGSRAGDDKFSCTVDRAIVENNVPIRSPAAKNVTCGADANNTCIFSLVTEGNVSSVIRNCSNALLNEQQNKFSKNLTIDFSGAFNKTLNISASKVDIAFCNKTNCNWNPISSDFSSSVVSKISSIPTEVSTPSPISGKEQGKNDAKNEKEQGKNDAKNEKEQGKNDAKNEHEHDKHDAKLTAATPAIPLYFVISVLSLLSVTLVVSFVILAMICKRGDSE